jgi:hypothetical protein
MVEELDILFGGSGVASAVAQPVDGQPMPISGGSGIRYCIRNAS